MSHAAEKTAARNPPHATYASRYDRACRRPPADDRSLCTPRVKRNRYLLICLAFLMLFLQQGAMLHAMSHDFGARHQVQFDIDHGEPGDCIQCLAYAQASGAASGSSPTIAPLHLDTASITLPVEHFAARVPHAYLSRAPPLV